jgi:hypothetical protein
MKLKQVIGTPAQKAKIAPTISLCYYNGRAIINAPSAEIFSLKAGDHIAFFQDEHATTDWYFTESKTTDGLPLKAKGKSLMGCNGGIVRGLMKSVNQYDSVTFYTSTEKVVVDGKGYWKILTNKTAQ